MNYQFLLKKTNVSVGSSVWSEEKITRAQIYQYN
jgi:hypothetical protein